MSTPMSTTLVQSEMPREVESPEQAIAFVTWCLDNNADDGKFQPAFPVWWLEVGRKNQALLPWVRDLIASKKQQIAYGARPAYTRFGWTTPNLGFMMS